jgi:membrane protease YdiL (CAAX protease family)
MKILKYFENFQNKIKKKRTRYILTFIGSIMFGIGGIASMGISQYSVYITSYFHHNQVSIDMQYGNLIMPILMLSNSIFAPLAGVIENKIGLYLSLISY